MRLRFAFAAWKIPHRLERGGKAFSVFIDIIIIRAVLLSVWHGMATANLGLVAVRV